MPSWPRRATVVALAALAVLAAVDVWVGKGPVVPIVFFVLAPVATALTGAWRETIVVAAAALVFGIVTTIVGDWDTSFAVASIIGLVLGSGGAVALARLRGEAERRAELSRRLVSAESRLTSALGALAEAVTVTDGTGRMLYVNAAAVDLLRARSAEELLAAKPGEVMGRFVVQAEDGTPISLADLPGGRLMAGDASAPPMLVRNIVRETGEERWLLNKATRLPDSEPELRIVNVIEDLTEIKRGELRQRLLSEATRRLAASLDYEETLQHVADAVVPSIADWCAVHLPGSDGGTELVAVAHADPEKVAFARELDARHPNRLDDETELAAVLRGDSGTVSIDVPAGAVEAFALDAEHLRLLTTIGFSSILVLPLDSGGRRMGAMVLVRSDPLRRFGPDDVSLAEALAGRAANAVLNARLYRDHAELATTLQQGILPPQLPLLPGWATAALYRPAGDIGEVGGDFFDAFEGRDGWIVAIGDVTGHGPEAATLTTQARYTLRTAGQLTGDPVAAIEQLNRTLLERRQLSPCTVACVLLSPRDGRQTAAVASAGHPQPLLVHAGTVRPVGTPGPLAGAFADAAGWTLEAVPMEPGDVLLLYTDGVVDALDHRGQLGDEHLHAILTEGPATAAAIIGRLEAALSAEPEQRRRDDTAAVALELLSPPAR
jgi:serine phosphatase RsbU (regulator of sigma subunit)/PAS domain-containing protein